MKPLPWSHSSLDKFKTCGHQYAEVKVYKRVADSQGTAAIWGDWAHTQIEEHYTTGLPWHENILPYVPFIEKALRWAGFEAEHTPHFELELGINTKLEPCGMYDEGVWGRGIIDFLVVHPDHSIHAIDWKFGKVKPDSKQMKMFALLIFYHFPQCAALHTSFEWLQHDQFTRAFFTPLDVQDLWREFLPVLTEYKNAFTTETFPKKQSGLCNGWCPVESCEYWRPKR